MALGKTGATRPHGEICGLSRAGNVCSIAVYMFSVKRYKGYTYRKMHDGLGFSYIHTHNI